MSYAPARARRTVLRPLVATAVATLGLVFAAQAGAAPAVQHKQHKPHKQKVEAKVRHDTLEIEGTFKGDTIALRLKAGLDDLDAGRPVSGQVDVARLTSLERDLLKDTLDIVKRFRRLIQSRFHLDQL